MSSTPSSSNLDMVATPTMHNDLQPAPAPTQNAFKLFGQLIVPGVPKSQPSYVVGSSTAAATDNNFLNQETLMIQEYVPECPMPLRWFCPQDGRFGSFSECNTRDTSLGISSSHSDNCSNVVEKPRKRKRKDEDVHHKEKRKASCIDSHVLEPPPTLDQIPTLLQIVDSHNGGTPVFLYQKRLQESDTKSSQNRLFVNEIEKLMEFLREEERRAVMEEKKSVATDAFDPQDTLYKLKISKWGSRVVVNGKWHRLLKANGAEAGDIVQLWGYRYRAGDNVEEEGRNPGFAVQFKKTQSDHHQSSS